MITLEQIEYSKGNKKQITTNLNAINAFLFNSNEHIAFSGISTLNRDKTKKSIENEKRLLYKDESFYIEEILKLDYLYNLLEKNTYNSVKENILWIITATALFIPQSFMEHIYQNWDNIIEKFTLKEKEILEDYKFTDNIFNISDSFNPSKNNLVYDFWQHYFLNITGGKEVRDLIFYNKQKYDKALKDNYIINHPTSHSNKFKDNGFQYDIVNSLSVLFHLNKKEQFCLNCIFAEIDYGVVATYLCQSKKYKNIRYWFSNITSFANDFYKFYGMSSENITEEDFIATFSKKELIENKIYADSMHLQIIDNFSFSSILGHNGLGLYQLQDVTPEAIVSFFVQLDKKETSELSLSDYHYLEPQLSNLVQSLSNNQSPKDILIWGRPGFGKTQLVNVISEYLNFSMCDLSKYIDPVDKLESNIRLNKLSDAKKFKSYLENFCILVDEAEEILISKNFKNVITTELENKEVTTFWIINDIQGIHEAYLRRFDYILELDDMPHDVKKNLAVKLLENKADESLAYKISQAIHTPADIKSVINWCHATNDYSWANISTKMSNYQKALNKSLKTELDNFSIDIIGPEQKNSLQNFAGYKYIKEQARDIVDIFAHPEKYSNMGAKVPKGILLAGAPGVGKTMFTRCLASEISTTIVTADSSALADKPERIKLLFDKAKAQAPCIIFIDEIDVLASTVLDDQNNIITEKQKILNQLLVEMDGFHNFSGIMVIGATHRSEYLDPSITRSGRFGKTIFFRKPSKEDRKDIFEYYCKQIKLDSDIDYSQLAKLSASFTSADITLAVNEAALMAAREQSNVVTNKHLVTNINQIFWGASLDGLPISTTNKWRTSIHEAGHALIAIKVGLTPQRATVRPHLKFMGMVELEHDEGNHCHSFSEIKNIAQIFLGGLVAEEIIFSEHSNGVESDLKNMNQYISHALKNSGMSKSIGSMTVDLFGVSNELLYTIEQEKQTIINEAKIQVNNWLKEHQKELVDFAKLLYEERSLDDETMNLWFRKHILKKDTVVNDFPIEDLIKIAYQSN